MTTAVLFDIDGTLVDSVDLHAEAWRRSLLHHGKDVPLDVLRGQIGKGGDQLIPALLQPDEVARFGEALERHRSELFRREYLHQVRAFPAVRALFERVRTGGHRVALASSCKEDELDTYLEVTGVADLIDAATTSDDAERSKPHPDVFAAALRELGVHPSRATVVGDSPYDAEAARRLGVRAIGVRCGGFPEADLRAAGCVAVFADPEDLLRRYDAWLGHAAWPRAA